MMTCHAQKWEQASPSGGAAGGLSAEHAFSPDAVRKNPIPGGMSTDV